MGLVADRACLNAADAKRLKLLSCCGGGAVDIDAPAGVFKDNDLEVFATRIFGRVADAEVKGEARQKHSRETTFAQVTGESRLGRAVVFEENRVGIDLSVVAFPQDKLSVGNIQVGTEGGPGSSLHAVVRPQDLGAVGDLDRLEGLLAGVRRRERQVPARMPVLREHDVGEFGRQRIDQRHNFIAARHGEAAAGAEVVLDVDDEKRVPLADRQGFSQTAILSLCARRRSTSAASLTNALATSTG